MSEQQKGGSDMRILEQMVKHNITDIKELQLNSKEIKKTMNQLEQKQILFDSNVNQINMLFSNLESQLRELQQEWKEDKATEQRRYNSQQAKQLKRYEQEKRDARNRWWGFAFMVLGAIVVVQLGLG